MLENDSLDDVLNRFANDIRNKSVAEDSLLKKIDQINSQYKTAWQNRYVERHWARGVDFNGMVKCNLLHCALMEGRTELALKLIELNVPINAMTESKCNELHRFTALMMACELSNQKIVEVLLSKAPDLSCWSFSFETALTLVSSEQIFQMMLFHAEQRKENLLGISDNLDLAMLCYLKCIERKPQTAIWIFEKIKKIHAPHLKKFLSRARSLYWYDPLQSAQRERICQLLKALMPVSDLSAIDRLEDKQDVSIEKAYELLYGSRVQVITTKQDAVKHALAEIYRLFVMRPTECKKYLTFLNREFKNYHKAAYGKDCPSVKREYYKYTMVNRRYYPMPTDRYKKIKKHSALQRFLRLLFSQWGVAQSVYKWIGYIPDEYAHASQARGDFFVENRLGQGLFHGKLSHMLQLAMIGYAIQDNAIHTTFYKADGSHIEITMQDIMEGHFSIKDRNGQILWSTLRDSYLLDGRSVTFDDPYTLGSYIMSHREDFPELADFLISSFCEGSLRIFQAYKAHFKDLTVESFFEKMNDINLGSFIKEPILVQSTFESEAKKSELEKRPLYYKHRDKDSAVLDITHRYSFYKKYKPAKFSEPKKAIESSEKSSFLERMSCCFGRGNRRVGG